MKSKITHVAFVILITISTVQVVKAQEGTAIPVQTKKQVTQDDKAKKQVTQQDEADNQVTQKKPDAKDASDKTTANKADPNYTPADQILPPGYKQSEDYLENPIRRFEIIALGSLPITIFFVNAVWDTSQYAASGWQASYAPWPVSSFVGGTSAYSYEDRLNRIYVSIGLSIIVAGVDAIIVAVKENERQKQSAIEDIPSQNVEALPDTE